VRAYECLEALDKLPIRIEIRDGRGGREGFEGIAVEFMVPRNERIHSNDKWERIEGFDAPARATRKFLPNIRRREKQRSRRERFAGC
jgi:hypothetical protein